MIYDNDTMRYYFSWFICLTLGFLPLVFLPVTQNYYDTGKWVVLSILAFCVFTVWLVSGLKKGVYTISLSSATLGLAAISIASLASLFFVSTNKGEAMLVPFGPVTVLSLTVLSLFSTTWLDHNATKRFSWCLLIGAAALGVSSVYQFAGMGKVMFPGIIFLSDPIWTPTGSLIASVSIFIILLPLAIAPMGEAFKEKNETHIAALSIILLALLSGLSVSLWQLIPRATTAILPIQYGWAILIAIFDKPMHAAIGFGAENFLSAFALGKPAIINTTPLWNTKFATSASTLLHFATTYGLVGAVATLYFLTNCIRKPLSGLSVSLFLSLMYILFIPPNFSVWILVASLVILSAHTGKREHTTHLILDAIWSRGMAILVGFLLLGSGIYYLGRVFASEIVFYKAIQAAREKRGTDAYNLLDRAIYFNPFVTRYHIAYSQINIAMVAAIAQKLVQNTDLSDDAQGKDRDLIAQLVQQAIAEAKIAINMNPIDVLAWENLAQTYQQLSGVAQGADAWATTAFAEAIRLDPVNPVLAVNLGNAYVKKQQYAEAVAQFRRAIALKPDYANAWYNLSNAYRLQGDITSSQKALENIKKIAPIGSPEYRQATEALEQPITQ